MKKPDEMRAEYRREDLAVGVGGKYKVELEGKPILPVCFKLLL
jgi:hypothetical protein